MTDWEKEFDARWSGDKVPSYQAFEDIDKPGDTRDRIKDFIRGVIAQRDAALVERLEKMPTIVKYYVNWPVEYIRRDEAIRLVNQQGDNDTDVAIKPSDSQEFVTDEEEETQE